MEKQKRIRKEKEKERHFDMYLHKQILDTKPH
jgi:hypothetical protein